MPVIDAKKMDDDRGDQIVLELECFPPKKTNVVGGGGDDDVVSGKKN